MYPDEEDLMELCIRCGGAGCPFCQGTGEVPYGTFEPEETSMDEKPKAQIVDLMAALKESLAASAAAKYPVPDDAKASRGAAPPRTLTIANETDQEVTYTVTPAEKPIATLQPLMQGHRAWTGADTLEHALAVAEEVGIGPENGHDEWETELARHALRESLEEAGIAKKPTDPPPPTLAGSDLPPRNEGEDASAYVDRLERERAPDFRRQIMAEPPPTEPRFGWRLREFARQYSGLHRLNLDRIADAIDRDAGDLLVECAQTAHDFDAERSDLRRKIEQLVEELRYGVHLGMASHDKDVVDADPFLERLGGIFGGRP